MLRYWIKLSVRKFQSNWLLFTGSIITVSMGALCISLLFSYVHNELTMNGFHKRVKDIYMMVFQISPDSQLDPTSASRSSLKFNYKDYPELESLVTLRKLSKGQIKVSCGESSFSPEVLIADSTFFTLFDFKLLIGNKKTILSDPGIAIITEDYARKIFGDKDPVGQEIKVTESDVKTYTIKGIIEKIPSNSSITFDIVLPIHSGSYNRGVEADFLLVNNKFNQEEFVKKIETLGHSIFAESKLSLISFDDIYFYENHSFTFELIFSRFGDKKNVYVLCVIMLIVFAITALNFSGFQVIQINAGIKSIGLGKIMGIKEWELFMQKTVEIMLLIFLSSLVVTIAYVALLPYFNSFTKVILSPSVLEIIVLNVTIIIALFALAMIYPAIITLKIPIIDSLKGKVFSSSFLVSQKSILTIQFTLTIASIIASLVIFRQVSLMLHKDLGFNSENIIRVNMYKESPFIGSEDDRKKREAEKQKSYQYLRNELASIPAIKAFSQGDGPLNPPIIMSWKLKGGEKDDLSMKGLFVQPDYLKVLGLKISEGRFFDAQKDESMGNKIVINETAKKYWGIKEIQESRMLGAFGRDSTGCEIIGVVKDFNYLPLSGKPQPLFMAYFDDIRVGFLIKFRDGSLQSGLQSVSKLFKEINPGEDFSYSLLSDEVAALHQKEKRLSQICFVFTIIALLITVMGIFVIAIYDAQRRTKEIGIRKVNGARIGEIMFMLNKDFVKLVLFAFIIACPIAWYAMRKWLENFAYKSELSWWIFAAAGALAVTIALLTVSWQSWRAATKNPVEALRYE
jgi:putative ABC transport system permease protein